jgi:alcohol dehydrogenase
MRALIIDRPGVMALREVPVPDADECLIRVLAAGICGTDLELLRGYAEFCGIPGHEFVGVVERAPARAASWVGRRVVGEINVGCGACRWCELGIKEHCERRSVVGIRGRSGAFAEFLTLPPENLHSVPDSMDDTRAVFVEPVAAACRILEQVEIDASTHTAIVGDGRMALVTAQVLRTTGATITIAGKHEAKLAVAGGMGFDVLRGSEIAARAKSFDLVVDVTGKPDGFQTALALARPRGAVVLKSTFHGALAWTPWPVIVDEISLIGSRCGPFAPAIALLAAKRIDVAPLVAAVHPLEGFEAAFDAARRELKVLFRIA